MALIPSGDFNRAKKRMQMGLHPAVVAAVEKAMVGQQQAAVDPARYGTPTQQTVGAYNRGEIPLSLGTGVSPGGALTSAGRAGKTYKAEITRGPSGQLQEVHDYGAGIGRVAFNRKPSAALGERLRAANPTLGQHMSNTATAEDKLLALAVRHAAAGKLAGGLGVRRKFSRNPGPMQRY